MDELNQEVRRKDQSIEYVATEKERILTRLEQEEGRWCLSVGYSYCLCDMELL